MQIALRKLVLNDKRHARIFHRTRTSRTRTTSAFDVSTRCNLFCEGCFFFNRDGEHAGQSNSADLGQYASIFETEKNRGVTYPLMAGAEPALEQDVLRLAAKFWSSGMVHTNGTRAIDPDLPFRLFISVWGTSALTKLWRGADTYAKSLRIAAADPRAIINYTVNAQNIDDILPVVHDCAALGQTITFQVYSPTEDYTSYLSEGDAGKHKFIQSDSTDNNLVMDRQSDARAEQAICEAIDLYPEVVVFTKALARWVFKRPGIFFDDVTTDLPPKNCLAGTDPDHKHILLGGTEEVLKSCGHGATNCKTCRTYTAIYSGYFGDALSRQMTAGDAVDFLEAHEVFDYLYNGHQLPNWHDWHTGAQERDPERAPEFA